MLKKIFLLGVGITNAKEDEILEYILQSLKKTAEKYYIVTPNPEILVYANKRPEFRKVLNNARLALCDGIGVFWAGKLLGKSIKQRVTGVDLLANLCKAASNQPITVGFLGGGEKIAERAAECLTKRYPGLKVGFAAPEWNFGRLSHVAGAAREQAPQRLDQTRSLSESRHPSGVEKIRLSTSTFSSPASGQAPFIDILFVAFGFPKQEEWMAKNIGKVPVRVMLGVGGAFDYISGAVPRAPRIVRSLGLEWFYRLIRQPWRLKRQVALLEFMRLVLKEKRTVML